MNKTITQFKFLGRIFSTVLLASFLTLKVSAQCPLSVSISLDGGGNSVSVLAGASIAVTGDFSIANDVSCPTCIQQIIIGIDSVAATCIYDAIPLTCPDTTAGTINTTITAPMAMGTYTIWANNPFNFSCTLSDYSGATGNNAIAIGTITVDCPPEVTIDMNGGGNNITVRPNDTVIVTGSYSLANPGSCPTCIQQLIIGIDTVAIGCVYDGIPSTCLTTSGGSINTGFSAPAAEGTYTLYANNPFNFGCDLNDYTGATGNNAMVIGTLTVACMPEVSLSLNGGSDTVIVSPGAVVNVTGSYSISNPSSCPSCIQQLIIGVDTVAASCVYDGIPDICPNVTSGSINTTVTAPADPGTYLIYSNNPFNFNCTLSDYSGPFGNNAAVVGVIIVECLPEVNISLNGGGNSITVAPGTVINVGGDYSVSNPSFCPTCIQQLIIGIDTVAATCIYDGIPDVCPNYTAGVITTTVTAPADTGVYTMYVNNPFNFSCTLSDYAGANGNLAMAVATITVSGSTGISSAGFSAGLSVYPNPGMDRIVLEFNAQKAGEVKMIMSNSLGQKVMEDSFGHDAGRVSREISTAKLDKGVYFVRLLTSDSDFTTRLIVE